MPPVAAALRRLYRSLQAAYGPQGWWPLPSRCGRPGFDDRGYHPGDFTEPRDDAGRFEVALGAVLTQNTAWVNAERALIALVRAGVLLPTDVPGCGQRRLAALVRPSGSYNVKARKLVGLASFFAERGLDRAADRADLLGVWGVGPETADSILLYAFRHPVFVVDAYTRRLLARLGAIEGREPYGEVQDLFHRALAPDPDLFNEFHALIVRHGKDHCRATPACEGCTVRSCPSRLAYAPRSGHNPRR
jgi:endonuclease III related protein